MAFSSESITKLGKYQATPRTIPTEEPRIYVRYIDGSAAYIPAPSRRREGDLYEFLPHDDFDDEDDSILFEFGPGDVVATELRQFSDGLSRPLAVRLVAPGDVRNLHKRMYFAIINGHPSFQDLAAQFGEEKVRQIRSETAKMRWVYPAISDWIKANSAGLNEG